ncbi:hypothetical protein PMIN06_010395 [Paraphaeosphaeria minitans]
MYVCIVALPSQELFHNLFVLPKMVLSAIVLVAIFSLAAFSVCTGAARPKKDAPKIWTTLPLVGIGNADYTWLWGKLRSVWCTSAWTAEGYRKASTYLPTYLP